MFVGQRCLWRNMPNSFISWSWLGSKIFRNCCGFVKVVLKLAILKFYTMELG